MSSRTDTLDEQDMQDELKQIEEASRKINTELEKLNIELQAPPRISTIEEAVADSTAKAGLPPAKAPDAR